MTCIIVEGGTKATFPLRTSQIDALVNRANTRAAERRMPREQLEQRFGTTMKPDGTPFYLVTYSPATAQERAWDGFFFTELGPCEVYGLVGADPITGIVSVEAAVSVQPPSGVRIAVSWRIQGPSLASTPANVAGILLETRIDNADPHDERCLRDCLALHAPDCVPIRRGSEAQLVAAVAAVAASCLVNCRC